MPQTGSLLRASDDGIGRAPWLPLLEGCDEAGWNRSEKPLRINPRTDRSRVITKTAMTASRIIRIS